MILTAEVVTTLAQAQELRRLRNGCREFMTGSTARISQAQQAQFWKTQIRARLAHAWLLREGTHAVAYALLRPGDGFWWLSCGVAAAARGRGLGTAVVRLAATAGLDTGQPVRLEVWADNAPAIRVYEKAGFVTVAEVTRGGRALKLMECR